MVGRTARQKRIGVEAGQREIGDLLACLTPREREVLDELALGKQNKGIAAALHITVSTVKWHIEKLMQLFGMHTRTQLAIAWRDYKADQASRSTTSPSML